MTKDTSENALVKSLIKAQTEMGKALKDSKNPHFKSSYADLASVMGATLPALNDNGFALMQEDGKDELGHYVRTIFAHEDGGTVSSTIYLVIDKQNMQGYGSAQTYARRYGLMGLAGIAPEDDDGNAASQAPKPPSADEIKAAISAIEVLGSMDELQNHWVMLSKNFHAIAAHKDVIAAKDKRKGELQLDDEIPH